MRYWLATHRVDLHRTHGDLIGCRLGAGNDGRYEPRSVNFRRMAKGDKVVVCSRSGDVVFGIYDIVSEGFEIIDDPEWGSAYCYKIDLKVKREPYPSFKAFKEEFRDRLDFVKDNDAWEGSSVGWIREITKNDFDLFVAYLTRPA
ncbi:MAG: hypothetical protein D6733_05000 [Methanobacteriota archaeon]|nr:MAG: hypothetical protein D6733_05000 [Euryarchaeota archaeon]